MSALEQQIQELTQLLYLENATTLACHKAGKNLIGDERPVEQVPGNRPQLYSKDEEPWIGWMLDTCIRIVDEHQATQGRVEEALESVKVESLQPMYPKSEQLNTRAA